MCAGRCTKRMLYAVSRKEGGSEEKTRGGKYRCEIERGGEGSEKEKEEIWGGMYRAAGEYR